MRRDLIPCSLLPIASLVALVAGAPRAVTGGLALAGLVLVAAHLTRPRSSGVADRALVGTGGVLVVLVLTGMLLGSTDLGLSPTSWTIAVLVLDVAGLALTTVLPARTAPLAGTGRRSRRQALVVLPWVALAAVVVVLAIRTTASSLEASQAEPVQLALGQISGSQVQVVVSSHDAVGPLEVRTSDPGSQVSYPLVHVPAGGSVTTTVTLPRTGRTVITLSYPGQTSALRTLILDR